MFLVTGIPGKTGSATAAALLRRGAKVTVLARSEEKAASLKVAGAGVIVGSLDDVTGLTDAMRGKEGVFLMIPPNPGPADYIADRKALAEGYAQAVRDSGIQHVVLLSSIGGEHSSGTGLILTNHNGEVALRAVAPNLSTLRAVSFLENWSAAAGPAQEHGIVPNFFTAGQPVPHIATKDIGEFAAEALLNPATGERIWYLTGGDYTPEEIAHTFGEVLGKPVQLQTMPDSQAAATLVQFGTPQNFAHGYQEMTQGINGGLIAIQPAGELHTGKTTAREVIAELFPTRSSAAG